MPTHLKQITREQWLELKSVGVVCFGTTSSLATIYSNTSEEAWGRWHRMELDYLDVSWTYYFAVVESEESTGGATVNVVSTSSGASQEIGDVEADN